MSLGVAPDRPPLNARTSARCEESWAPPVGPEGEVSEEEDNGEVQGGLPESERDPRSREQEEEAGTKRSLATECRIPETGSWRASVIPLPGAETATKEESSSGTLDSRPSVTRRRAPGSLVPG